MERDFFSADKLSSFGNFLNKPGFTLEGYLLHGEKTAERVLACQRVDEWLTQHAEELEGIADKVTEKTSWLILQKPNDSDKTSQSRPPR